MKKTPSPDQGKPQRLSQEERDYFQAVEAHFIGWRGKPLLLSPLELQRTAGWHREGIPLRDVCLGIDRYFEERFETPVARERAVSLKYCESYVRRVFEEHRTMAVGRGAENREPPERGEVEQALTVLYERLVLACESRPGSSTAALDQTLGRAVAVVEQLLQRAAGSAPGLTVHEVERELDPLEREMAAELRRLAGSDQLAHILAACEAEILDVASPMDPAIRKSTLERMMLRRLRETGRIPEISLFAL